jgi:mannose-6-phosphate isomerase-like protein (cupin superfamily)
LPQTDREFVLGRELRTRILTAGAETDGRHDFTDNVSAPGSRTPPHVHTRCDERFWVVSGELTVWAGTKVVTLRSGDFYAVPMGVPHAVGAGPAGARALHVSSPAAFAELIAGEPSLRAGCW